MQNMKKVVLFGAGQSGAMISRLLGTGYTAVCFADNSVKKQGTVLRGIPVVAPEDSLNFSTDCFCVCVLDEERSSRMEKQIRDMGFDGEILKPDALEVFDPRLATMRLLAEQIYDYGVEGDIAELGVFRGEFAEQLSLAFPDRTFALFDTFEGFDSRDVETEKAKGYSRAEAGDFSGDGVGVREVRSRLHLPERAEFYTGWFPSTFTGACAEKNYAFVSIDADLYAPTAAALPLFYDRLSPGGAIMVHDVNSLQFTGAGEAVREFCRERKIMPVPVCDLHGSVVITKPH